MHASSLPTFLSVGPPRAVAWRLFVFFALACRGKWKNLLSFAVAAFKLMCLSNARTSWDEWTEAKKE
jgi:hypothetical protein